MRKIPTLFVRDSEDRAHVLAEVNPECQWVIDGEGVATRKWDGTCTRLDESGEWWARREVKPGKQPPPNWVEEEADPVTGKRVGWEPMAQSAFAKFHAEALHSWTGLRATAGTYELVGPKINGNPEGHATHLLMPHGTDLLLSSPRDFAGLREWMAGWSDDNLEGVVWWHPDGRRAKLKVKDFR
ncbi:hypothetical protein CH305_18375 [Rhodococcus sp. 15-649-2-2]|uniref:RNA ligase 1 family protein n=1 Tax=Rhodococcus sp. 15-649-2-2 TaxID=2023140 RepID=UPI000B9A3DB8|nr:DUF5565 family protein [Rhodococcus sp. 15-649-2-2]OZE77204.1 hypothetical protein CH305_18375 [Rhodococcus sp. 15-649-2-2]